MIFDSHLDLSLNALEWNRDQRWPLERIRRWELQMKDKVDRGTNTVCFPEMRRGRVGPTACIAIETALGGQITRYELRPDVFGEPPGPRPTPSPEVR